VSDFITSIFEQLKEGKDELTFGFTGGMAKNERDAIEAAFNRMNG
jgi:uncharacterized oxidoreductase